ncbi:MAG: hypothetical protein QXT45_01725 [Candidatus Bilamarchaeaceae archaeon]
MEADVFAALPVAVLFAFLSGVMVFIATYIHFPRMEKRKRIALSLKNAFALAIALLFLVYAFLVLILRNV